MIDSNHEIYTILFKGLKSIMLIQICESVESEGAMKVVLDPGVILRMGLVHVGLTRSGRSKIECSTVRRIRTGLVLQML